ncbi:serine/threonine-protein kinase [Streptomyces boluensis]|uniref:Protein kinase n=1 Tax=Streptomyces boluensis TaxID=1775135 RepID=A0A964UUR6_9ACTN|nr:serine/threonine-protein kinase [Streptomyces boluensis]NBE54856.1 protein kinase [Streptomyces boluensis]
MFSPLAHDDPEQLGAYRPLARLGSGGMGTVFLARSDRGRTAAVKTMHAGLADDPTYRTRFRLEVDAARVIGGVHGAEVFDADPLAPTPWMATEYVLGPPLEDAVELAGPLPEPLVRALGARLCTALAQLHRSDVVHRDLKPSNIMVTVDGPKVIDFGIARAIGDERLTSTGAAAGTPAFMSPEQATGQEHTSAGDVFALAGVLSYASCGSGPFGSGQTADLLYRVRYAEPDLTGVPEGLRPVLLQCLHKDPQERPDTTALAAQLGDPAVAMANDTGQLAEAAGQFTSHLPAALLAEIGRRATEVWRVTGDRTTDTTRLPEPAETRPGPSGLSRRRLLVAGGGSALGLAAVSAGTWAWLGRHGPWDDSGPAGPATPAAPSPSASLPPRTPYKWKVDLSPAPGLIVPPALLDLGGDQLAVADGRRVRVIETERGHVKVASVGTAPPHRCTTQGKSGGLLYLSETARGDDGPLTLRTINLYGSDLEPEPVEVKGYNGSLTPTQLICAEDDEGDGTVFLCAGQGRRPTSGFGFTEEQKWYLLAVDAAKGKVRWRVRLPRRPASSRRLHFLAAQAVDNHLVLLQETAAGGVLLSVRDLRTGKPRWDQPLPGAAPGALRGRLEVEPSYEQVYPPAGPSRALRLSDGKEEWRYGSGNSRRTGPPALTKGTGDSGVCVVEEGTGLVKIDPGTGEVLWREQGGPPPTADDLATPPLTGAEYIYRRSGKAFLALDTDSGLRAKRGLNLSGDHFSVHESVTDYGSRILALGGDSLAGYPID